MKCRMADRCDWRAHYFNERGTAKGWQCRTCGMETARKPMTKEQREKNAARQREFQARRKAKAEAGGENDTTRELRRQLAEMRRSRDEWRENARDLSRQLAAATKARNDRAKGGIADLLKVVGGKRRLVFLLHPDRHGGCERACAATQWVNDHA